jgi:hypothetical protein
MSGCTSNQKRDRRVCGAGQAVEPSTQSVAQPRVRHSRTCEVVRQLLSGSVVMSMSQESPTDVAAGSKPNAPDHQLLATVYGSTSGLVLV